MRKALSLLVILALCVGSVEAQAKSHDSSLPDSAKAKAKGLMPEASSPDMQRAAEIKEVLDKAFEASEPKLKKPGQLVKEVVEALKQMVERHKKASKKIPGVQKMVDLTEWRSSSTTYDAESNTVTTYFYNTTSRNPYDTVVVKYDAATGKALSATGYINSPADPSMDLSQYTLTSTLYYSSGAVARKIYESAPSRYGTVLRVTLRYDSGGQMYDASQTVVQPLNLKKVKLPVV